MREWIYGHSFHCICIMSVSLGISASRVLRSMLLETKIPVNADFYFVLQFSMALLGDGNRAQMSWVQGFA